MASSDGTTERGTTWHALLAEATTEGVMVHEQGRILQVNGALARMLGYTPAEMVGLDGVILAAPADRPALQRHLARADESPLDGEALRRDGSTFPCRVLGRTVEHGERAVRVVLVRDLTEQRAMEAAIMRREWELASIARNTPDVLTRVDAARRILFMSGAVEAATGVPATRFVGAHLEQLDALGFPLTLTRLWQDAADRVFATGEPREVQFSLPDPQGVLRHYHTRIVAERDAAGTITSVLGTTRDLTAVHEADAARHAAEERFRALVEHSGDLLAILEPDGTNRYASPSHERVLGTPPNALLGRRCFEFVHPEDADALRALFVQAMRPTAQPIPTPPAVLRFAGHKPADPRTTPPTDAMLPQRRDRPAVSNESIVQDVCDVAAPPTRAIAASRSATDVHARDGNARAVAWRTLAVTLTDMRHVAAVGGIVANSRDVTEQVELHERLRRSERLEALGQLAGGVAHDFNNILAAISGFAQLLRADLPVEDPRHAEADEIVAAAARGAGIVRQLLTFSRVERLQTEVVDLAALAREIGRMLRVLLPASVQLVLPSADVEGWVRAARTSIEQIVVNLAVNARDAMPEGGTLYIEVQERPSADADAEVVLRVRDTGTGIPDAVRDRIFDPFFTTKPMGQGTGLGLSTVYGLVRQLGGLIEVESAPGTGSTFSIVLPASAPPAPTGTTPIKTPGSGRGRILLVDDEPAVRRLLAVALRRAGYDVVATDDGQQALARLSSGPGYDLLLTDVTMPEMGGLELIRRVRTLCPGLRVVLMSGHFEESEALLSGSTTPEHPTHVDAFVRKPFDVAQLVHIVAQTLVGS